MNRISLEGRTFGRLTVLIRCANIGQQTAYECLCSCGKSVNVRGQSLRRGETQSCGCLRKEVMADKQRTHGKYKTGTYNSWRAMLARCGDKSHKQYADYGGRGITVCERWRQFAHFLADMGDRPAGTTIDRMNNNGNYEPGNCKWSTRIEQNRNKRTTTHGEQHA